MEHDGAGVKVFTDKQWFALPLALRQRWWRETDYGAKAPSAPLLMEILVVLSGDKRCA
jgi:hypothetical protein